MSVMMIPAVNRLRDAISASWIETDRPLTGDELFYIELLLHISRRIRRGRSCLVAPANYVLRTYHLWDDFRINAALNGLVDRGVLKRTAGKYRLPDVRASCSETKAKSDKKKAKIAERTKKPVSDFCTYCRRRIKPGQETVDHVIPKSRGGSDDAWNLVICCKSCNERKGDRRPHEWAYDILYFNRPRKPKRESRARHAVARFRVAAALFISSIKFWGTH